MLLDVLEADFARNGVDTAALRPVDAQGLDFSLIAKLLQRDDLLRRSYLRRRWQRHRAAVSLVRDVQVCNALVFNCAQPPLMPTEPLSHGEKR
jgi:hypothetical protein